MEYEKDEELIKRYLEGDEEALTLLVKRYIKPVYNFLIQYLPRSDDFDDVVQETFIKVWKHIRKFDQSRNFKVWVFSIAKNTAIDWLRKRKALPVSELQKDGEEIGLDHELPDDSIPVTEMFDIALAENTLKQLIGKLPERQRVIVFLRLEDGLTFQEISEILSKPLNTVKSDYRRAAGQLKKWHEDG